MKRLTDLTVIVILAKGFDILAGRVEVEVPWVQTRSDYAVSRKPSSVILAHRLT